MKYYGVTMNGEELDESTTEELYRIAEYEILEKYRAKYNNITIDEDSWEVYGTGNGCLYSYRLSIVIDTEIMPELKQFTLNSAMHPDFNILGNFGRFELTAVVENNIIKDISFTETSIYENSVYNTYFTYRILNIFDFLKIRKYLEPSIADIVFDIKYSLYNL